MTGAGGGPAGGRAARTPLETAEAFFAAQSAGDVDAVVALFAEDATWVIPGDPDLVPWVGTRDRKGIAGYVTAQRDNAEATGFERGKTLVDGPDVVVLGRFAYRFASGGSIDDPFVVHLQVEDGLIRHFIIHEDSLNLARQYTGRPVVEPG